jgi:polyhydroxyalkanoate synthesis regulator phasin
MQVKVIKKGQNTTQQNMASYQPMKVSARKTERKVEEKIMDWISDLREKKNLEFARTQMLLSSIR